MRHPWLKDVNWDDFRKKRVDPPWKPDPYSCNFDNEYVQLPLSFSPAGGGGERKLKVEG